jgi:hypothetical protein
MTGKKCQFAFCWMNNPLLYRSARPEHGRYERERFLRRRLLRLGWEAKSQGAWRIEQSYRVSAYSFLLILCLNLGNIHLPLSDKKQAGPRNNWTFLSMFRTGPLRKIVTTFVAEPLSLLWIAGRTPFGHCQKLRDMPTFTGTLYSQ